MDQRTSTNSTESKPAQWRTIFPIHPAADSLPMMGKDELRELADDIEKNGLQESVNLYRDKTGTISLLDGRNRLDALELLGRKLVDEGGEPNYLYCHVDNESESEPFDVVAYVISKNVHRRHLTTDQKRELLAKLLKANPEKSNREVAKLARVDDKTVANTRKKLERTAEIPQLKKTKGKDGKSRPTRKKVSSQASAKPAQALNDSRPIPEVGVKSSKPEKDKSSANALAEFRYSCRAWFPKMNAEHRAEAIKYFTAMVTP